MFISTLTNTDKDPYYVSELILPPSKKVLIIKSLSFIKDFKTSDLIGAPLIIKKVYSW